MSNALLRTSLNRRLLRPLAALALAAASIVPAQAETTAVAAVPVEDFSVFVDIPTGFAFVKTPAGWRFVRRIEAARIGELHPSTLVSIIQAGERIGQNTAAEQAPVL